MSESRHALDPVTRALLTELRTLNFSLADGRLRHWQGLVARHPKRQTVGTELVAIAVRLLKARQEKEARLVCEIAWSALGDLRRLASELEKHGVDKKQLNRVAGTDWRESTDPALALAKDAAKARAATGISVGGAGRKASGASAPRGLSSRGPRPKS